MRRRVSFVLGVCTCALGLIATGQTNDRKQVYKPSHAVRNLPELAVDAKKNGLSDIEAPSAIVQYPAVPSIEEVLSHFTVALVKVRTTQPHYAGTDQAQILSDITFDVLETLSENSETQDVALPSTLTVTVYGGTMLESGVKISQRATIPEVKPDQRYIVILKSNVVGGKVHYYLIFGPDSLIEVAQNNMLGPSPWIRSQILRDFMLENSITSLSEFRTKIDMAKRHK